MQQQINPTFTVENVEFVYSPNFQGKKEKFNKEGDRYFNVGLPEDVAQTLLNDGWNVKYTKPSQQATPEQIADHVPQAFLKVAVGYEFRPPTVILIRDGVHTPLNETTIELLDTLELETLDVEIRGSHYELPSGERGIKAYLKTMYATKVMSALDKKYGPSVIDRSNDGDQNGPVEF